MDIRARLFRDYPNGDFASHVLGYIGRINDRDLEKIAADGVALEDLPRFEALANQLERTRALLATIQHMRHEEEKADGDAMHAYVPRV